MDSIVDVGLGTSGPSNRPNLGKVGCDCLAGVCGDGVGIMDCK